MSITGHTTVLRSSLMGVSRGCNHISFTSQWLSRNTSTFPTEAKAHKTKIHGNMKHTNTFAIISAQSISSILTTLCKRGETPSALGNADKPETPQGLVQSQRQKVDPGYSHLAMNCSSEPLFTFLWRDFLVITCSTQIQQSYYTLNEASSDQQSSGTFVLMQSTSHAWVRLQR